MEDDEDIIKKSLEKEYDYDEYSVEELLNQIKNLRMKKLQGLCCASYMMFLRLLAVV